LLYRSATLYFGPQGNCVCGQLQELVQREHGPGNRVCKVRLGPKLANLGRRFSQRIFSDCSVPQIIEQVLKEHGIADKDRRFELEGDYFPRVFCTQYQESDLQFLQRLCAQEQLHFHFEQRAQRHCVVFRDDQHTFPRSEPARFRIEGGQPAVRQFELQHCADSSLAFAECQSDLPGLRSGQLMPLSGHPLQACNHSWLLTHIEHHGSQDERVPYRNQIRACKGSILFAPVQPVNKPRMHGLQRGWVVEVDELRPAPDRPVPVQLDWLYQGEGAVPSHCWLPLATPLQAAIAEVLQEGTEVVVSFIDGDPDRPLITGLLYRPENGEKPTGMESAVTAIPAGVQQWLGSAEPLMLLCLLPGGGSFNHCTQVLCTCRAATRLSQSGRS
jgi:type VI secretion system secreted protein VgrG